LEARIEILEHPEYQQTKRETAAGSRQLDQAPVRAHGPLGNASRFEHPKLLADIATFEIGRDFRVLTLPKQRSVGALERGVVARGLHESGFPPRCCVHLRLVLSNGFAKASHQRRLLGDLPVDIRDLSLEILAALPAKELGRAQGLRCWRRCR